MGLEVRRAISLHEKKFLTEVQLFNTLINLAIGGGVDRVMTRIPSDYLVRFRDWAMATIRDKMGHWLHDALAMAPSREWASGLRAS